MPLLNTTMKRAEKRQSRIYKAKKWADLQLPLSGLRRVSTSTNVSLQPGPTQKSLAAKRNATTVTRLVTTLETAAVQSEETHDLDQDPPVAALETAQTQETEVVVTTGEDPRLQGTEEEAQIATIAAATLHPGEIRERTAIIVHP